MSTTIRPEVSSKNEYWIERHRYYELKHFCLQYPIWKKARTSIDGLVHSPNSLDIFSKTNRISDPTERCAEARMYYSERIDMIDHVANQVGEDLSEYIIRGITEGLSYDILRMRYNIPCCKDVYYNLYRKFFWTLNKVRG